MELKNKICIINYNGFSIEYFFDKNGYIDRGTPIKFGVENDDSIVYVFSLIYKLLGIIERKNIVFEKEHLWGWGGFGLIGLDRIIMNDKLYTLTSKEEFKKCLTDKALSEINTDDISLKEHIIEKYTKNIEIIADNLFSITDYDIQFYDYKDNA